MRIREAKPQDIGPIFGVRTAVKENALNYSQLAQRGIVVPPTGRAQARVVAHSTDASPWPSGLAVRAFAPGEYTLRLRVTTPEGFTVTALQTIRYGS